MPSKPEPDPGFWTRTACIQLTYGVWVNLTTVTIGLAFGFPAVQIPQLVSPASDILVTTEDASWIASVLSLFCPIGCMISGLLMDKFGRSLMILLCQVPICIGWIYTGASGSTKHIIIGRAIMGVGCGMAMGPPRLYTTEISLPNMRGLLGAFPNVFLSSGITIQATMGSLFQWRLLCRICGVYSVLLFGSYFLLEETPHFLLMKDCAIKARYALATFRAADYNVDREMTKLIEFKQDNNIRSLSFSEKMKVLFTRGTCRPFGILITYVTIAHFSGGSIVTFWTIQLLLMAKASNDAHIGNILISLTRLIFGAVASALLFRVGRRQMSLVSASGVSFSCVMMGLGLHYNDNPSFLPQLSLMLYTGFASLGFYIIPFLLMGELYRLQIRGTLIGISISIANIQAFWCTKWFPYVIQGVGLPNTMLIFGAVALFGVLFLYLFLPETKHLTLQEIEEYFSKPRLARKSKAELKSAGKLERPKSAGEATERGLSLHTINEQLKRSRTILAPVNEEDDADKRSFVEVSASATSLTSLGSRKSVTLFVDGKQFKNLTAAEDKELKHLTEAETLLEENFSKERINLELKQSKENKSDTKTDKGPKKKKDAPGTSKDEDSTDKQDK